MKRDYHLHTEDSFDSAIKARELAARAIELGYDEIAITEHLDLLPQELAAWGMPSLTRYHKRILELRKDFPQLKIIFGVEIGDYHQVKDTAVALTRLVPFELVLGSVHFLSDHTNVAIPLPRPLDSGQREDYFRHNLALVSACDINVLAHLGVYKRYYPELLSERQFFPILKDVFEVMISREIALEINFSSLRKTYPGLIPDPEIIELYRSLGGKRFTIGSDAHRLEHFDDFYHHIPPELLEMASLSPIDIGG